MVVSSYRLWKCKKCGAFFNVSDDDLFPDGSSIDESWHDPGFVAVGRNVTCCSEPRIAWASDCSERPDSEGLDYCPDSVELDNNVSDFPQPEEKKIDRFDLILVEGFDGSVNK